MPDTVSYAPRPAVASHAWFALQVKTTHEQRVAASLDQKGFEQFVPVYRQRRRWSDRIKEVERPLFPGYVFCRFDPQVRSGVVKTAGVARIVGVGPVPAPIDDGEISAIRHALASGLGMQPHPYLTRGQRVRIDSGPLEGVEGLILDLRRRDRLILSVSLLQRSLSVEIETAWVTPVA